MNRNTPDKIAESSSQTPAADTHSERGFSAFPDLIELTLDGIYLVDAESGRVVDANESACQTLGYAREELLQLHVWEFSSVSTSLEQWREMIPEFIDNQLRSFEDQHIHRDGHLIPTEIKAKYLERQNRRYFLSIARDISERKQAEANLRESETLLRTTLDSTTDGILVIGHDGRVITANRRFQEIWDIPDDLLQLGDDDKLLGHVLGALEDPEGFIAEVERLYGTEEITFETIRFADGRVLERYTTPLKLEHGVGRMWSFRDISQRERALTNLQNERSFLKTLFKTIPDLLWLKNPDGIYLTCNDGFETALDARESGIIGKTDQDLFPPEEANRFRSDDIAAIKSGKPLRHVEKKTFLRPGYQGLFETIKTPMYRSDGELIGVLGISRDVTAARQAEQAVREIDARRKALLDASLDGIAIIDQEHRVIEANKQFCNMLGYNEDEILELHTWDYEAQASEHQIRENFADLSRIESRFETRHRRKDGSEFDAEVSVTGREVGGAAVVIAIVRDISDKKRAKQALEIASQQFTAVLNSTSDGFWIVDLNGWIAEVNQAYCRLSGYTAAELVGKHVTELDMDDVSADARNRIQRVMEKGGEIFESRHQRKDGSCWPVEVSISYSPEQGRHLFCFLRDISERKQKEQELQLYQSNLETLVEQRTRDIAKQKTAFETLFEKSPNGELIIENDVFVDCNQKVLEILGYSDKQQFLPCSPVSLSPPTQTDGQSSEDKARTMIELAYANNGHRFEWIHSRANGDEFWCEITLTPISLPGRDNLLLAGWRDLSEQRAIEKSLQNARKLAESASRLKSEFLANMSHEIRTPMNAIIGMTHLALKSKLNEKQHNHVNKAHQAAVSLLSLLSLLNDILDFSKIEAGKLDLDESVFEPAELLENLSSLMKQKASEKDLRFSTRIDTNVPPQLLGAPLRIGQVLINLVSNAIKFTPVQGSIDVTIELKQQTEEDATLEFQVIDTGIGLSQEQQEKLFQPFTQIDSSASREFGGAGLGLAISRQLVRAMGGEIMLTSQPGRGSNFRFELDLIKSEACETTPKPDQDNFAEQAISALNGARVLLVEDNEINLELAMELLDMIGVHTNAARNGKEAIEALETQDFDGILMDCQMPVMDGYEATRKIRGSEKHGQIPVIAMTANTMKGDRQKALEAGMNDHIPKPLDPQRMYTIMENGSSHKVHEYNHDFC